MTTRPYKYFPMVLSAPSGGGKSAIREKLLERDKRFRFSVTCTTRPRRPGEVEGRDYYFVTPGEFSRMRGSGQLLEWARVYDRRYGTPKSEVTRLHAAGRDALFDLDIVGGHNLMRLMPDAISVFILPPRYHDLQARLTARGKDDAATIARRLAQVASQCAGHQAYRYLIVNDDLEVAASELLAIVRAERTATSRRLARAQAILATFETPAAAPAA